MGEDELCPACERVDLYSLFTGPRHFSDIEPVRVIAKLGTLQEVKSNTQCLLCRLVKHELYGKDTTHPWAYAGMEECNPAKVRCSLRAFRSDYDSEVRYVDNTTKDLISTTVRILLEAEPGCSKEERDKIIQYPRRWGGHLKLLSPESVDPKRPLLNGYPTTTLDNGLKLLAKWLDGCIEHHGTTCQRPQFADYLGQSIPVIRAIEISTRRIVEVDPSISRYATLSWVWGANHAAHARLADKLVVTQDSVSLPAEEVPQLMEDAIYVCQKLAIPYLWVDVYCIHQENHEVRAAEISAMGYIYHLSCITLVASYGATLLGHRSILGYAEEELKVETIRGRQYISTYSPLVEPSLWASRAWTYQEGQLATRIAFFDAREITFYCSSGQWSESVHSGIYGHDIHLPEIDLKSHGSVILSASRWLESPLWDFNDYAKIALYYNRREITYESDKLDAISGCLNLIAKRKGVEFVQGMPSADFHYAFLFTTLSSEERREGFPSWSWAGWFEPNLDHRVRPKGHDGVRLESQDEGSLSYPGGDAADRELQVFRKPKTSNRCSQRLACLRVLKATFIVEVRSEVVHFTVHAVPPQRFQLQDRHGNVLMDGERGFQAHRPWWSKCGESTKERLHNEGIELISIIKAALVEGTFPWGDPLDHVLCVGINRATTNPKYVERWGTFFVPRKMWETAEPKEMTVEFC